ncbi:MAG TPA: hypothetical protein VI844_02565 [Coxiellaceae bacterium]|nr:hypothetical protein [Coxiellaceae bacterium]
MLDHMQDDEKNPLLPQIQEQTVNANRDYFSWIFLFGMLFTVTGTTAMATWIVMKGGLFHGALHDNTTSTSRSFQTLDNDNTTDTPSPSEAPNGTPPMIALAAWVVAVLILTIICCNKSAIADRIRAFFKKPAANEESDRRAEEMARYEQIL